jgi:cyclopropane-fatty-acyl-phospholipid synthase
MWKPLDLTFDRLVRTGDLVVVDSAGHIHRYGDRTGDQIAIRLADRRLERQLVLDPELALGEGYMQGRLQIDDGDAYGLVALLMRNLTERGLPRWSRTLEAARRAKRRLDQFNSRRRAARNVRHHYEIDPRIYDLFLDPERQYSCAYFDGTTSLAAAQRAKMRHIAAKLRLAPGQRVLDIGSGWGGLARYLARSADVAVDGITLSSAQAEAARARAEADAQADRLRFEVRDYRDVTDRYDRIVSVGMLEHVGTPHFQAYFDTISRALADDGVALVHAICRADDAGGITNPFIAKYVFPGGYIPALSEVLPAIERAGLIVTDIELLRLHYAETLRAWRERFLARRAEAERIAGAEFCRMWEIYLAGSEAAFRYESLMVFQVQLAKRIDTLPITRDYMLLAERRLARAESVARIPGPASGSA